MIIDVFMYNDERDHLRCRMYELQGIVDYHVAVQGNRTMAGTQKPWHLEPDEPGVTVIDVDISGISDVPEQRGGWVVPETQDMWKRDWKQRNGVMGWLSQFSDDDVIIYSDADEIPKREAVLEWTGTANTLGMHHLIYSMRLATPAQWIGATIGRKDFLPSFADVRNNRWSWPIVPNAGWHLGWFGGPDAITRKIAEYAHGELVGQEEKIREYAKDGLRPADGKPLSVYDGDVPAWVGDGHAPDIWFSY